MAEPKTEIWLDDRLVLKHFGMRPFLGRRLPITMRRYTGVEWRQFGKKYVPKEQTVNVVVALIPVKGKRGYWEVQVDPYYREYAMQWLVDVCGAGVPAKAKRHYTKPRRVKVTRWGKMPMRVDNG